MKATNLFRAKDGRWVTTTDLQSALETVGADDCSVLYMHTGLSFGPPNPQLKRAELMALVYEIVRSLGQPTLCVPTYTFSFCNDESYDVAKSRSRMGMLNEFIRHQPGAIRSLDPLMSVALVGADRDLVENLGHESVGRDSTFDKLRRRRGVKFLFLGVRLGDCFTYMHHLEWVAGVPYRYHLDFTGWITGAGKTYEDTYKLFVRYDNVKPNLGSHTFEQLLVERRLLRVAALGDASVSCIAQEGASALYLQLVAENPNYFITEAFEPAKADRRFFADNMVTL